MAYFIVWRKLRKNFVKHKVLIEEQLQVFERRILRKIFGPICDSGKWCIRYNSELHSIYTDPDIIKTIKILKLHWTGHIMRIPEETPVKKLTLLTTRGK